MPPAKASSADVAGLQHRERAELDKSCAVHSLSGLAAGKMSCCRMDTGKHRTGQLLQVPALCQEILRESYYSTTNPVATQTPDCTEMFGTEAHSCCVILFPLEFLMAQLARFQHAKLHQLSLPASLLHPSRAAAAPLKPMLSLVRTRSQHQAAQAPAQTRPPAARHK